MSRDMNIVCLDCKEALWIGQSDIVYIGDEETMQQLQDFLVKHRTYYPRVLKPNEYHELLYIPEPYNGSFEEIDWKYVGDDK